MPSALDIRLPDAEHLTRVALFSVATVGVDAHSVETTDRGTWIVKGVEIFKAATFKDSMGDQKTWTREHLAQMVYHFNLLRDSDLFPNVPVRKDHGWSVDDIVGWFTDLYIGGAENDRLLADIEFTEPDAFQKFDRGTFRSRSLEVGMYETNDEDFFWPVVMGLAFVDIPAVEGLHRGGQKVRAFALAGAPDHRKESDVPQEFKFRVMGQEHSDFAAVQAYITKLEGDHVALQSEHASAMSALETFRTAAADRKVEDRKAFVAALAAGDKPKIVAPQVASLQELAAGMTDEQFAKFQESYEAAPALALLQPVGAQDGSDPKAKSALAEELEILEGTVEMFRQSGLSEDQIKTKPSYARLQALKAQAK